MSTRANIIVADDHSKIYFYRHWDGYPEVTGKILKEFLRFVKNGTLRKDAKQSSGWLIVMGYLEYNGEFPPKNWKVGAFEPTDKFNGDVDFIYYVDVWNCKIYISEDNENWELLDKKE